GTQGQDLNVLCYGFAKYKAVRSNSRAWPDGLHFDIAILVNFKGLAVFPDEAEHLFIVTQHGVEPGAAVDKLLAVATAPAAIGCCVFSGLDAKGLEII